MTFVIDPRTEEMIILGTSEEGYPTEPSRVPDLPTYQVLAFPTTYAP